MNQRLKPEEIEDARCIPLDAVVRRFGPQLGMRWERPEWVCPGHANGDDSLAVNTTKGLWFNRFENVGGNDAISFVRHAFNLDFVGAVQLLLDKSSGANTKPVERRPVRAATQHTPDDPANRQRALKLWDEAERVCPGGLVWRYLTGPKSQGHRGLSLDAIEDIDGCLRSHPKCPMRNHATGEVIFAPAMVGVFRSIATNEPVAIHRTALTPEGRKLTAIPRPKQFLAPVGGAAIKLSDDENVTHSLAVAEGIESTLSGMMEGFCPAWALGSSGGIQELPVLSGIECLTIIVDSDDAGLRASQTCRDRWVEAGREVHRIIPPIGLDMADLISGGNVNG
jgi:putative DNA primase/helicase